MACNAGPDRRALRMSVAPARPPAGVKADWPACLADDGGVTPSCCGTPGDIPADLTLEAIHQCGFSW